MLGELGEGLICIGLPIFQDIGERLCALEEVLQISHAIDDVPEQIGLAIIEDGELVHVEFIAEVLTAGRALVLFALTDVTLDLEQNRPVLCTLDEPRSKKRLF